MMQQPHRRLGIGRGSRISLAAVTCSSVSGRARFTQKHSGEVSGLRPNASRLNSAVNGSACLTTNASEKMNGPVCMTGASSAIQSGSDANCSNSKGSDNSNNNNHSSSDNDKNSKNSDDNNNSNNNNHSSSDNDNNSKNSDDNNNNNNNNDNNNDDGTEGVSMSANVANSKQQMDHEKQMDNKILQSWRSSGTPMKLADSNASPPDIRQLRKAALAKLLEPALRMAETVNKAKNKRPEAVAHPAHESPHSPQTSTQILPQTPPQTWPETLEQTSGQTLTQTSGQTLAQTSGQTLAQTSPQPSALTSAQTSALTSQGNASGDQLARSDAASMPGQVRRRPAPTPQEALPYANGAEEVVDSSDRLQQRDSMAAIAREIRSYLQSGRSSVQRAAHECIRKKRRYKIGEWKSFRVMNVSRRTEHSLTVWIQESEAQPQVEQLFREIVGVKLVPLLKIAVGGAALVKQDGKFRRVTVKDLSSDQTTVQDIDTGDELAVSRENLFVLPTALKAIAPFAMNVVIDEDRIFNFKQLESALWKVKQNGRAIDGCAVAWALVPRFVFRLPGCRALGFSSDPIAAAWGRGEPSEPLVVQQLCPDLPGVQLPPAGTFLHECLVTHADESSQTIYVTWEELHNTCVAPAVSEASFHLKLGSVCLQKSETNVSTGIRCCVEKVLDDRVWVRWIDCGAVLEVSAHELYPLPSSHRYPATSVKMTLSNNGEAIGEELARVLLSLANVRTLVLDSNDVPEVLLFTHDFMEANSANLNKLKSASYCSGDQSSVESQQQLEPISRAEGDQSSIESQQQLEPINRLDGDQSSVESQQQFESISRAEDDQSSVESQQQLEPRNRVEDVNIVGIATFAKIWVVPEDTMLQLEEMEAKLASLTLTRMTKFSFGEMCAVKENHLMRRAVARLRLGNRYLVRLVDRALEMHVSEIFELPEEFRAVPSLSVRVALCDDQAKNAHFGRFIMAMKQHPKVTLIESESAGSEADSHTRKCLIVTRDGVDVTIAYCIRNE